MNRKLLALAVGAALALPLSVQAAPTVYGLLNMSVDRVDIDGGADNFQVNSNSSRLGVKGEEALNSNLSVVYQLEWGVAGDVAGVSDLTGRDRFLGLKGAFGTFKLGAYNSPLQDAQGRVDQFDDMTFTDIGNFIVGENRMNNLIGYESPKLADAFTARVVLQPGETNADDGPAEAISASLTYEGGPLYAALAYDSDVSNGNYSSAPGTGMNTLRLAGTYTMDALQLGALLQTAEVDNEDGGNKDDQDSLVLSAAYTQGQNTFKGQVLWAQDDFDAGKQKTLFLGVGMDHHYTKMTTAYAQLGLVDITDVDGVDGDDQDGSVITVGLLTRF